MDINCCSSNTQAANNIAAPPLEEKNAKKWKELGFAHELAGSHPEFVQFMMQSGMAFTMAMFRNSLATAQTLKTDNDGHPQLLMNGAWTRWEEIQKQIDYDPSQESLIAKGNPAIGYNFIHPDGIVQKHPSRYEKLYPVAELSAPELTNIQEHARTFWETHEEVDPGEVKDCVLQVVTSQYEVMSRNWFTENLIDNTPGHVYLRLIDKKGKLTPLA